MLCFPLCVCVRRRYDDDIPINVRRDRLRFRHRWGQINFLGCLSVLTSDLKTLFRVVLFFLHLVSNHILPRCSSVCCHAQLNSKNLTDGGPVDDHADPDIDQAMYNALNLPGARRGDDGSRRSKVEVLTLAVAFSSTGREWAAVSGEGLHVYSLDEDMIFDPISLTEAITPAAVHDKLSLGDYSLALRMALHLNEASLVQEVMEHTPFSAISLVVRSFERAEPSSLERLLQALAKVMATSPHMEFYLQWCLELLQTQGMHMEHNRGAYMRAFRALHKVVQTQQDDLRRISDENKYLLDFLHDHSQLAPMDTDQRNVDAAMETSNTVL